MTRRALWAIFALLLVSQAAFALSRQGDSPDFVRTPPPPTAGALSAMALGDNQTLYRALMLDLFLSGDGGGRLQPLRTFDYARVQGWLRVLDPLAPQADLLPSITALYYGLTPNPEDLRRMVTVLVERGRADPDHNWRWLSHAAFLARHRLDDLPLALEIATLAATARGPKVPLWVRQMPVFVLDAMGEAEAARLLMTSIAEAGDGVSAGEMRFMEEFISDRSFGGRNTVLPGDRLDQ